MTKKMSKVNVKQLELCKKWFAYHLDLHLSKINYSSFPIDHYVVYSSSILLIKEYKFNFSLSNYQDDDLQCLI